MGFCSFDPIYVEDLRSKIIFGFGQKFAGIGSILCLLAFWESVLQISTSSLTLCLRIDSDKDSPQVTVHCSSLSKLPRNVGSNRLSVANICFQCTTKGV
jgi:hypothetical protein